MASDPSITTNSPAVDSSQLTIAQARQTNTNRAEPARKIPATEACVEAQTPFGKRNEPTPATTAARATAARKKFNTARDETLAGQPTAERTSNSAAIDLNVTSRPR